jgi:hypothetical protein
LQSYAPGAGPRQSRTRDALLVGRGLGEVFAEFGVL